MEADETAPTAIIIATDAHEADPAPTSAALAMAHLSPEDREKIAEDVAASHSERTRDAYAAHWRRFVEWCGEHGHDPMPAAPAIVLLYLRARADEGLSLSTLSVDLAAISQAHLYAGKESPRKHPAFKRGWKGLRRRVGEAGGATPERKAPVEAADVASMVAVQPDTLIGIRNRAILALGFAGAFRRSELAGLELRDVEKIPGRGLRVTVRKSKTDQEGEGLTKAIPFGQGPACPVRAVSAWLDAAELGDEGPLFRSVNRWGAVSDRALSGHMIARIVKSAAAEVGLDADRVSGHSLRAGFVTTALDAGVSPNDVTRTTGHRSLAMISTYDRRRDVWTPCGL